MGIYYEKNQGDLVRDVRRAADDAPTLPFLVQSGGSRRRGAWTLDVATDAVPVDGGDNGSLRSALTSAAERRAMTERKCKSWQGPSELRGSTRGACERWRVKDRRWDGICD